MITPVGSLGTGNDKSVSRQCIMSPVRDVPAGRLLVLYYANDSLFDVGVPTDGENFFRAEDSAGNVWCTIGSITDQACFFRCGAISLLFGCQLQNPLTTADTITVEAAAHDPGSVWAKAMSVEEFELGAGMRWCLPGSKWTGVVTHAADPDGLTTPAMGGPVRETLTVHCLAAEGPDTDTYTWDANYTQIAGDGTTGGADDENIHVRGGYWIAPQLLAAVDVASVTADRDYAQTMNIICEVPAAPFPTTPILDDFNRADEAPLDNGDWDTVSFAFHGTAAVLVSSEARGGGGSWWDEDMSGCGEAYYTIKDWASGAGLHYFGTGASQTVTMQAIHGSWVHLFGGLAPCIVFGISDNRGDAKIASSGNLMGNPSCLAHVDGADGHKIGLQRTRRSSFGAADHLWIDKGAGWEEVVARSQTDQLATPAAGRAAVSLHTGTVHIDDFGGGETRCFVPRPQIMRY